MYEINPKPIEAETEQAGTGNRNETLSSHGSEEETQDKKTSAYEPKRTDQAHDFADRSHHRSVRGLLRGSSTREGKLRHNLRQM